MKKLSTFFIAVVCSILPAFAQPEFITEWANNQSSSNLKVEIAINPDLNLNYNYSVDWGDGTSSQNVTTSISHTYQNSSNRMVKITGDFPAIFLKNSSTNVNLIDIHQWGEDIEWHTMASAFANCINLGEISATDKPNLEFANDMSYMFFRCKEMKGQFNNWDVKNIKYMRGTFSKAKEFNSELGNWDVSNVADMTSMFEQATSFNRDILDWKTIALEEMGYMFSGASAFNQYIGEWNTENVTTMDGVFANTQNYNQPLKWKTSKVVTMHGMFSNTEAFNQDLVLFMDVTNVKDMSHMFQGAEVFDQNLGGWNIENVTDMRHMLSESAMSTCNYESTLNGWTGTAPHGITLGADGLTYYQTNGRNGLTANFNWNINGDIQSSTDLCAATSGVCGVDPSTYFKTSWTVGAGQTITIPAHPTSSQFYNYDIDWDGDGVFDAFNVNGMITSPAYSNAGTYQVAIRGTFPAINFSFLNQTEKNKIVSIDQWGCIIWKSFNLAFSGCTNLNYNATDAPNLANVTEMIAMFQSTPLNGDLNNWDVSNVQNMSAMFSNATNFNGNIDNWDVSNVTNFHLMFNGATSFNRNIDGWDVSAGTNFGAMFQGATSFNKDLNNWDVDDAIHMHYMFSGATNFNGAIGNWNVGNVTNMIFMFNNATSFNKPINSWNVGNVTNMNNMFYGASSFNQPLHLWNVQNVTSMGSMFWYASSFNQPLGAWKLNSIGQYNVNSSHSLIYMLSDCGMLRANYEATLDGWAANPNLPSTIVLGSTGRYYCGTTHQGRPTLINNFGWTIFGDTDNCSAPTPAPGNNQGGFNAIQTSGYLNISPVSGSSSQITGLNLYDINGKLVYQNSTPTNTDINTQNLSSGVYLLIIESTTGIESKKVVVNE